MAADELKKAKVYRVVTSSGGANLGQLIGVISDSPRETLMAWARRATIGVVQDPKPVPELDGTSPGVDHVIKATAGSPGYELVNRLKQSPFERILTGTG